MRKLLLALGLLMLGATSCPPQRKITALRLKPGQDLKIELQKWADQNQISSGWVVTGVGSLQNLHLRLANQPKGTTFEGPWEIVSLVGTLGPQGIHLHLSASDSQGKTLGGHLMEGCKIFTTAEIVLEGHQGWLFQRILDPQTGYPELAPKSKS
jgi:predicted DNA-binding protein with PD1-like motif